MISASIKLKNPADSAKYIVGLVVPVPWPQLRDEMPLLRKARGKFIIRHIDHRRGIVTVESAP